MNPRGRGRLPKRGPFDLGMFAALVPPTAPARFRGVHAPDPDSAAREVAAVLRRLRLRGVDLGAVWEALVLFTQAWPPTLLRRSAAGLVVEVPATAEGRALEGDLAAAFPTLTVKAKAGRQREAFGEKSLAALRLGELRVGGKLRGKLLAWAEAARRRGALPRAVDATSPGKASAADLAAAEAARARRARLLAATRRAARSK